MESILVQASSYAARIDNLIILITVIGAILFFTSEFLIVHFLIKFRRSKNPKAQYITGEKQEETKWIHWPHYAVIALDLVLIFFAVKAWYGIKQDLPQAESTVRVIGQQWAWRFVHPGLDNELGTADDIETVDELRVKVDTTYHYKLESVDVLHSFSIPVFRLKQDSVPGRMITGWFRPIKTGEYDLQCAEMCGIGHGIMGARVIIETEEEHNNWLRQQMAARNISSNNHVKVEKIRENEAI